MTKSFIDLMKDARALVAHRRLEDATATIMGALSGTKSGPTSAPHEGPTLDLRAAAPRAAGPASIAGRLVSKLVTRPRFPQPFAKGPQAADPIPDGASFETHIHAGASGSRAYKLYVPSNRPAGPRPLLVMLHGCTQDPDDFARGTRMNRLAEEAGILVAYPEQPQAANAQRCWNWFEPAHQTRGGGEPDILAGIVAEVAGAQSVDPRHVFVAGLSAGGAMAAVLGATHPELFAAIGVHSGLPYGAAGDVMSALGIMRTGKSAARNASGGAAPRLIVFHGAADRTVHPANGEAVAGLGRHGGTEGATTRGTAGGRAYTRRRRPGNGALPAVDYWSVEGLGHAWSGGDAAGSHCDPTGPDASREMLRFFLGDEARV